MNTSILGFNGKNNIYKISFSSNTNVISPSYNVLLVSGTHIVIPHEQLRFETDYNSYSILNELGEGACIELDTHGKICSTFGKNNDNTLYITDKCNSNCIMCPMAEPARKNGQSTPFEILDELIEYMPCNMEHLTITGGEPFYIREKMFDILTKLKSGNKAHSYLLLSNGRIFANQNYCHMLAGSVPEDFLVGIPLHGPNPVIHDTITQTPGSFEQTTNGIKNLLSTQMMSVEIRIVVNKINAPYLLELAHFIILNFPSIHSIKFMGMEMLGNAIINSDKVWIDYKDAFLYIKPAINLLISNAIDVAIYNFPLCFVDRPYWHICMNSITKHKIKYSTFCNDCIEKKACGGMFTGTDKYLSDKVQPITL
ncbi:His-Xaa-Ser system radical SAM maturase HxsC [Butyrivibrio sp. MC2013]|uniref:His-Xaa-Ser system radical SAM maturase HxsC n=1 Tax=Butyrivibrio sp. MC2013 TaxID=1280686 RepID=UPI000412695F|nr:His-Xaa-Ser system radical SAM maturase HxsC [Butyrivibrio sp. MC2013]